VEVLAIAIPLQAFVGRLVVAAFGERLADAKTSECRVRFGVGIPETADPTSARIVVAVPAKLVMYAIHQVAGSVDLTETEEVADRERVGPQVALLRRHAGQSGALCEARHQHLRGLV
jgi:hypothetical protein